MTKWTPIVLAACVAGTFTAAEGANPSTHPEGLTQTYEMQASVSDGQTPLWLNANKYGLSSLSGSNGYVRGIVELDRSHTDSEYVYDDWGYKAGADLVAPIGYRSFGINDHYTNHLMVQQLYVEGRYRHGVLSVGAKQRPLELKNTELSSGSQTLGINARPVPQVRLGLEDYWAIPGLRNWVAMKLHAAFGVMTDGDWEEAFAKGNTTDYHYNRLTRYHEKAGYLRIGNERKFPLSLTLGLEMAAQFGGKVYNWKGTDATVNDQYELTFESGPKNYLNTFLCINSGDAGEVQYKNNEGNQLGSWLARLDWKGKDIEVGAYFDHFFEDHSSMLFIEYDGYGSGEEWDVHKDLHFFLYDLKDALVGVDMKLKNFRYLNQAVVEFMNTTYQSGPVYHDHTTTSATHIGGRDDYYNHSKLSGWQHWGQVIGNPLYLSPIYNNDGLIGTKCNRFTAWHAAIAGDPIEGLHYRAKVSWQKGLGSYNDPFLEKQYCTSLLLEGTYSFASVTALAGFDLQLSFGADFGKIRGDHKGLQATIRYHIK